MTEPKHKHARDLSPAEYAATLNKLRRGQPTAPQPVDTPQRSAKDMSEREREEWFQEHRRKFQ
jgi:hypothetical protein